MGTNHSGSLGCQQFLTLTLFISQFCSMAHETFLCLWPVLQVEEESVCCCCCFCCDDNDFSCWTTMTTEQEHYSIPHYLQYRGRRSWFSQVLVLIYKFNPKFGASVFTRKWIIEWPGLLCVTDGDVTHGGSAQPGRVTKRSLHCVV